MDCGESARIKYPYLDLLNNNTHLMSIIDKEDDINFLTTLLYSKYRSITLLNKTIMLKYSSYNHVITWLYEGGRLWIYYH